MYVSYLSWTMFKSPGLWDKFNLDCILGKEDQLIKFIGKFGNLEIEDLPQAFFKENASINVEFLENKPGEISAGHTCYLFQKF